jgi:hypothetical protein
MDEATKARQYLSLGFLCVLCASVVVFLGKVNHRDTENTEAGNEE